MIKKRLGFLFLFILFTVLAAVANAQDTTKAAPVVFDFVQQMPKYPGGDTALFHFLARNIHYPDAARDSGIQGSVKVEFIIDENGRITNVKAINKIGWSLTEEAIRVIKSMPDWIPGKQEGKNVKVKCYLPVSFKLEGDGYKKEKKKKNKSG